MKLSDCALRSLVTLLDDEDSCSLDLVRRRLLDVGTDAIPYLEAARVSSTPEHAERLDDMADELRHREIAAEFTILASQKVPDLESGALLISRWVRPLQGPDVYRPWLDRIAANAAEDIPEDATVTEAATRLAFYLYQRLGFGENEVNYYDPDNSSLTRVIDTRRGIPVTLSVLYLLVAKRLQIPVYGVGTPGHFLIGFRDDGDARFLDSFRQGRRLGLPEVKRMLVRNGYEFRPEYVRPCGPREILARMMRNLLSVYQKNGSAARAERLSELVELILTGRPANDAS